MAPRDRGQTENKGSDDPGSSKSPCLSWGNLTCLYDSYTGINGRRKEPVLCRIRKKLPGAGHLTSGYSQRQSEI